MEEKLVAKYGYTKFSIVATNGPYTAYIALAGDSRGYYGVYWQTDKASGNCCKQWVGNNPNMTALEQQIKWTLAYHASARRV